MYRIYPRWLALFVKLRLLEWIVVLGSLGIDDDDAPARLRIKWARNVEWAKRSHRRLMKL